MNQQGLNFERTFTTCSEYLQGYLLKVWLFSQRKGLKWIWCVSISTIKLWSYLDTLFDITAVWILIRHYFFSCIGWIRLDTRHSINAWAELWIYREPDKSLHCILRYILRRKNSLSKRVAMKVVISLHYNIHMLGVRFGTIFTRMDSVSRDPIITSDSDPVIGLDSRLHDFHSISTAWEKVIPLQYFN